MKTDKELYQIYSVDVCTMPYAIDFALIGARDVDDLLEHLPSILKEMGVDDDEIDIICKRTGNEGWYITPIIGAYTDIPYKHLTSFGYYE